MIVKKILKSVWWLMLLLFHFKANDYLMDLLFCDLISGKVYKSGSSKVVVQTRIFFSGQPLFSNLKKCGFIV